MIEVRLEGDDRNQHQGLRAGSWRGVRQASDMARLVK